MFHCADHPTFTSTDPQAVCPDCGNFVVDEKGNAADASAPAPVAFAPSAPSHGAGLKCPHCGEPMEPGDDFCMSCGKSPKDGAAPAASSSSPSGSVVSGKVTPTPAVVSAASVSNPAVQVAPPEKTYPATLRAVARFFDGPRDRVDGAAPPSDRSERSCPLDRDVVKIGRTDAKNNIHPHISLDGDAGMSRKHAQLLRNALDGSYGLQDVGSSNGTKLNGVAVTDGLPLAVKAGDVIEVGFWFTITIEAI